MATPDPEGVSLLAKVVAAGAAIIAPIGGAIVWIENRYAHKHSVAGQFQAVTSELATQRGHIAKVFDQIRENEQRAQDRHERLMDKLK